MATSFPTSLDVLTNPTSADTLASPDHAAQHANVNDAVEAIEAAIGTTASPVLASLAGPQFTGVPTAPTAAPLTNTTQIATTAYVVAAANTGPQGSTGAQGSTGSQGTAGSQGSTGAQGSTGSTGSQGTTGSQGSAGSQGAAGAQGTAGPQGSTGSQGPTGSQGSAGAQGTAGSQGTAGAQGSQGATGSGASFGYTSGVYYRGLGQTSQASAVEDVTYYFPLRIDTTNTFDRITVETSNSYIGTGAVRLGIYNNDSATGKPSTVLLDAGTVSTTAATTIYQITISQSLSAGNYWFAWNMQTAASTPIYMTVSGAIANSTGFVTSSTGTHTADGPGWQETGVTGAFATAGTLTPFRNVPTGLLRSA